MSNIWRKEFEEGIEINMLHRPLLDDMGQPILDADGMQRYQTTRVRSLSAGYILDKGRMPASIQDTAIQVLVMLGIAPKTDEGEFQLNSLQAVEGLIEFQRYIVDHMVLYPKVVEKPKKDDEISYEMLSNDDLMFYMALIDEPLANLRTFPPQSAPSMATVPAGEVNGVSQDSE